MKVYIVRHGQVPHNAMKLYSNENEDLKRLSLSTPNGKVRKKVL